MRWNSIITACGLHLANGGIIKRYLLDCLLEERIRENQRLKDILSHLNTSTLTISELILIFKNTFADEKGTSSKRKRISEEYPIKRTQQTCDFCDKPGHSVEFCRKKKKMKKIGHRECQYCAKDRPNIKNTHDSNQCYYFKNKTNKKEDSDYFMFVNHVKDNSEENKMIYIPTLVDGERVLGIVDTGCNSTIISKLLYKKICDEIYNGEFKKLSLADGSNIECFPHIINLGIGKRSYPSEVLVACIEEQLIIGLDSMRRYGIGLTNLPLSYPDEEFIEKSDEMTQERISECIIKIGEEEYQMLMTGIDVDYKKNINLPENSCCSNKDSVFSFQFKETVEGKQPIQIRQYSIAQNYLEAIDKKIEVWKKNQIIKETNSAWCFPLLAVPKKDLDGKKTDVRICWDCRELNNIIKSEDYKMPLISDVFEDIGNAKYFSVIDLKDAFHSLPIREDLIEKIGRAHV